METYYQSKHTLDAGHNNICTVRRILITTQRQSVSLGTNFQYSLSTKMSPVIFCQYIHPHEIRILNKMQYYSNYGVLIKCQIHGITQTFNIFRTGSSTYFYLESLNNIHTDLKNNILFNQ